MRAFDGVFTLAVLGSLLRPVAAQKPAANTPKPTADCAAAAAITDHGAMDHSAHADIVANCGPLPKLPGQAAYGAISEIVRLLEADPMTDWSKVNIEALRQHLIDMDDVIMNAVSVQREVPGGMEATVTGTGRTVGAIRRMVVNHAATLSKGTEFNATTTEIPGGVRLVVVARSRSDLKMVARVRGLGFAGLLTEGDHHAAHHMALARGAAMAHDR